MSERVTGDELEWAAEWLESYEGNGDEAELNMMKVARWLRAQAAHRAEQAAIRKVQQDVQASTGTTPTRAAVRAALHNAKKEN